MSIRTFESTFGKSVIAKISCIDSLHYDCFMYQVLLSVLFLASAAVQAGEEAGTVDADLGKTMEASRTDDETLQK